MLFVNYIKFCYIISFLHVSIYSMLFVNTIGQAIEGTVNAFQYILCYSLTIQNFMKITNKNGFQYILCYSLTIEYTKFIRITFPIYLEYTLVYA